MADMRMMAKFIASGGYTEREVCEFCFAFLQQVARDQEEDYMVSVLVTTENKMMSMKPTGELYE